MVVVVSITPDRICRSVSNPSPRPHPPVRPTWRKMWGEDGLTPKKMEIWGGSAGEKASDKPPITFLVLPTNVDIAWTSSCHSSSSAGYLPGRPVRPARVRLVEVGVWAGVRGVWLTHPPGTPHDTGSAAAGKKKNRSDGRHIHSETTTSPDEDRLVWRRPPRPPPSRAFARFQGARRAAEWTPRRRGEGGLLLRNGGQTGEKAFSSRRGDRTGRVEDPTLQTTTPPHTMDDLRKRQWCVSHRNLGAEKVFRDGGWLGRRRANWNRQLGGVMQSARSQIPDRQVPTGDPRPMPWCEALGLSVRRGGRLADLAAASRISCSSSPRYCIRQGSRMGKPSLLLPRRVDRLHGRTGS